MAAFVLAPPPLRAQESPLLWPLICYAGGVCGFEYLPVSLKTFSWGLGVGLGVGCGVLICLGLWGRRRGYVLRFAVHGVWFLLACGLSAWHYTRTRPEAVFASDHTHSYRAYLLRAPVPSAYARGYRLVLQTDLRYTGSQGFVPLAQRVRLHYYAASCPFQVGDEFWIRGAPTRITARTDDPEDHAYVVVQARRGIYFRDHASPKELIPTGRVRGNWLWIHAQRLQARLRANLTEHLSPASAGLAQGLLLGEKSGLSPAIREAFAATGSMHLLAVSGLHVGVLYATWLFLAALLPLGRYGLAWRLAIAILGLWGFAFVVGLSASVLRAATLCTLLAAGTWVGRRGNAYNSLAAAALLILLLSPQALFALSFQLSFLAVLGILLFYKPIYALLSLRYKLTQALWGAIAVSLAAQAAVFPLIVYHFQLLSLIFPLTNVLLTPTLFLILPLSFGIGLLSSWAAAAELLALALEPLLQAMVWLTEHLAGWAGSHLYPIYYSTGQLWLLYAVFFVGICCLVARKPAYILLCAGLLLAHGALDWQRNYRAASSRFLRLGVDAESQLLLQYIHRGVVHQSAATDTHVATQRFLQRTGYAHALGAYPTAAAPLLPVVEGLLYASRVGEERILWLSGPAHKLHAALPHPYALHTDYLVLTGQTHRDIAPLLARFRFRTAIIASRSARVVDAFRAACCCQPHVLAEAGPFYQPLHAETP